jgi:hypothetical protein
LKWGKGLVNQVNNFWLPLKKYGEFGMAKKFRLQCTYSFRNLQKRYLACIALSKHVTKYSPLLCFWFKPHWVVSPTQGCTEQLCRFEPWEPSPVPTLRLEIVQEDNCPKYNRSSILLCSTHYYLQQITV